MGPERGLEQGGELLDTVDQTRAGAGPGGVGIDGVHRDAVGQGAARDEVVSQPLGAGPVEAAGCDHDDLRLGRVDGLPGDATRLLPGGRQQRVAPGRLDHLRDPVPGRERRVGPLQEHHARPGTTRGLAAYGVEAAPVIGHQPLGRVVVPGRATEGHHRREHVVEGVRVDGQHLGRAPEVGQRVVDDRDVDRTDRAEVLGDHEVGVQVRERALVEVVEVVAAGHRGDHELVDRGGAQALGHRRGRDDPAGAGLGGEVALEGHADHVVARADREQDLGGRGEQRDDPHAASLGG